MVERSDGKGCRCGSGEGTLTFGEEMEVPVDLVVLAVGMEPNALADLVRS